jgi:hypothetical protein
MRLKWMVLVGLLVASCHDEARPPKLREPSPVSYETPPESMRMSDIPTSSEPSPRDSARSLKAGSGKCLKTARALFKQAKDCGIDIGDRTAAKTCSELFADNFNDEMAVGCMRFMTSDGCQSLRIAIDNDRI